MRAGKAISLARSSSHWISLVTRAISESISASSRDKEDKVDDTTDSVDEDCGDMVRKGLPAEVGAIQAELTEPEVAEWDEATTKEDDSWVELEYGAGAGLEAMERSLRESNRAT